VPLPTFQLAGHNSPYSLRIAHTRTCCQVVQDIYFHDAPAIFRASTGRRGILLHVWCVRPLRSI
jgi:hypothetical protein